MSDNYWLEKANEVKGEMEFIWEKYIYCQYSYKKISYGADDYGPISGTYRRIGLYT